MLKDKIEHYFNRYPELRVLFLFDAPGEYRTDFDELDLPGFRKLVYHNNDFELKVQLNNDWFNEKVVLYLPVAQPVTRDEMSAFPMLDLLFANKSMQPDDSIGDFMEKYGLQRHQRSLAEKYLPDLKYKNVQEVMKPYLVAGNFIEENIVHGLLASLLKFTQPESWELVIMRLLAYTQPANDSDWKRVNRKIAEYGIEEFLLNKIKRLTGISLQSWSHALARELLDRIKYNLLVQDLGEPNTYDPYKVYWYKDSSVVGSINLLHERLLSHTRYGDEWTELLNSNHSGIHEKKLVELYGTDAPYHYFTNRLIWEILAALLETSTTQPGTIISVTDRLMAAAQGPLFQNTMLCIYHSNKCREAIGTIESYVLDRIEQYVSRYANQFYKIDQYYRKAIWYYRFKIDFADIPVSLNWEKQIGDLNSDYRIFLEKLNREWLKCWSTKGFDINAVGAVPQFNFYKKEIQSLDQKVAVIISDALRYEAGLELMEALNADAKNVAQSSYMVASVPSKTSVGMANLLPGKEYAFNEGKITVDGISAESGKRGQLLKAADLESMAVKLTDLQSKTQKENREIFKSKIVYIYHDVIDAAGDKAASEKTTFDAVNRAIEELTRFIKQLHSSYNVAKVIITADHGFLYNDFTLEDRDKERGSGLESVISHSRFEIVKKNDLPALGYIFPLSATTKFKDDLFVVIPGSVNRYSRPGAGNQYVHGGASLQELIVPVIESTRKREDVSGLVTPELVTKDLKVVSNVLKFTLLQKEPISAGAKERSIVVGLYKGSELVSNEKQVDLNRSGDSPTERAFQVDLHLVQHGKMESMYKLKMFDKNDKLNALVEADVKNQTLIQSDF